MAQRKKNDTRTKLYATLKIIAVFGLVGLVGAFFAWAARYVQASRQHQTGDLVFVDPPAWVDQTLLSRVTDTVGDRFYLRPGVAEEVSTSLNRVPWLYDVTVKVIHETVRVHAQWRKPLATVKSGRVHFCVDRDLVVLDALDLPLSMVSIEGVRYRHKPAVGSRLEQEDLAAAVDLIDILHGMDEQQAPAPPLLAQIDTLDISNFRGRDAKQASHIFLTTKEKTRIDWGAEIGAWGENLENSDTKKLAQLYTAFKELNYSFSNLRFINLKDSPYEVPFPLDQY